jgi:mannose-1-phosphate guanylyltransferase
LDRFEPPTSIRIVAIEDLAQDIWLHLQTIGEDGRRDPFHLEPPGKNTAPAIGFAAVTLNKASPDSIMNVMSSDSISRVLIGD